MSLITYNKTKGFAKTHGQMYEVKLSALLFLRGLSSGRPFMLASNVDGAGAFDDVLFKLLVGIINNIPVWQIYFFQLKHKEKDNSKVFASTLTGPRNDFSLKKYLDSFITIKNHIFPGNKDELFVGDMDNLNVILYTNADVSSELKNRPRQVVDGLDVVKSSTDKELIFRFCKDEDKDIYSALEEDGDDAVLFLDRLLMFVAEPGVAELDDLIKREMSKVCESLPKTVIDLVYPIYLDHIQRWWSDSNIILDQNSEILDISVHQYVVDSLEVQQEKELSLNVRFREDSTFSLQEHHQIHSSVLHIGFQGSCAKMVSTKFLQVLWDKQEPFIFLGFECFVCEHEAVVSTWKNGERHLLVLVKDSNTAETEDNPLLDSEVIRKMVDVLQSETMKWIVLISPVDDVLGKAFKEKLGDQYKEVEDHCNLLQLEDASVKMIMDTAVQFQGSLVKMKLLLEEVTFHGEVLELEYNLVNTLMGGSSLVSFGQEIAIDISFFIRRTLLRYNFIKNDIFNARTFSGRLVMSGVTMEELQKLLPFDREEFNQMVSLTDDYESNARPYLVVDSQLDSEIEFNELCKRYSDLHWLQVCEGKFLWMKSNGNMSKLKEFIDVEQCTTYKPAESFDLSDRVVVLVAEPGMGKSTQLTRVANMTKQEDPSVWVIRVDLNDHTALLNKTKSKDFNATDFLATALALDKSPLENALFRYNLEQRGNVIILLDGFDEISPRYTEEGKCLIESLLKTKVKKVWIASRYSMMEQLENPLSTISITLQRFTEEDQRKFFLKYWEKVETPLSSKELEEFIIRLLEMTAQSMNDKEKQFTGIPLQTQMLAEVFEGHIVNPSIHKLPEMLDLLTLYEKFVDKKFDIYIDEKRKLRKDGADDDDLLEMLRELFNKNHTYAALILLFDKDDLESLKLGYAYSKAEKFLAGIKSGREKTGIVDRVINNKPNFTHQTFAEYFVAVWFSQNFKTIPKFLERYLFSVSFKVIRNIFDRILARSSSLHTAVLNGDVTEVEALLLSPTTDVNGRDDGKRTALHLASAVGFRNPKDSTRNLRIVELLLNGGADVSISDTDVLQWTPLRFADATRSYDVIDHLLSHPHCNSEDLIDTKENVKEANMLKIITKHGFVKLMSFLLDQGLSVDESVESPLLHKSSEFGNAELVNLLITRRGDMESRDQDQSTPLHVASYSGHVDVVQVLVTSFNEDRDGLVRYLDLRDSQGQSALHVAVRSKHLDVVDRLIKTGADITSRTNDGHTLLHIAAASGQVTMAQHIFDTFSGDQPSLVKYINLQTTRKETSLHMAVKEDHRDMLKLLVEEGGDVKALNQQGYTPLHVCAAWNYTHCSQILIETFGHDRSAVVDYVNTSDNEKWTSLHHSARVGHREVLQLLVQYGADVALVSSAGHTPLHLSMHFGHLSVCMILLESLGGDRERVVEYMNTRDVNGQTPISICRSKKREELVAWMEEVLKECNHTS